MRKPFTTILLLLCTTLGAHAQQDVGRCTYRVAEYVNTINADAMAHKAAGGIIVCENGAETRAFSQFNFLPESADAYADAVNRYKEIFGSDMNVFCMPIPIAVAYYLPDMARGWSGSNVAAINRIFSQLRADIYPVDVYSVLAQHVDEPIYSRTDHHWSPLGAYYAAECFSEIANVPFRSLFFYESDTVHQFVGTMYRFSKDEAVKRAPEDFVYYRPLGVDYATTMTFYTLDKARRRAVAESEPKESDFFRYYKDGAGAAYCTFMGGDDRLVCVRTSTNSPRRLLILKDSFGNALPGYLFYSFSEIHVVDCRYFTKNVVDYAYENQITDILFANNVQHACTPATSDMYIQYLGAYARQ